MSSAWREECHCVGAQAKLPEGISTSCAPKSLGFRSTNYVHIVLICEDLSMHVKCARSGESVLNGRMEGYGEDGIG